jgi:hypothetical protein
MRSAALPAVLFAATAVLGVRGASASGVVGFREPYKQVCVAVRGAVPAGTVITGIRFLSNDKVVYPEVRLATDASCDVLPHPERIVARLREVPGRVGYVEVGLPGYEVGPGESVWAIIELPGGHLSRTGAGGGPGIGWREEPGMTAERSFFTVDGGMGEFQPAFDISIVTPERMLDARAKRTEPSGRESAAPSAAPAVFEFGPLTGPGAEARFRTALPASGTLVVTFYNVLGERVARLETVASGPGFKEIDWSGADERGHRAPSGIYLYQARFGGTARVGKALLWR